MKTHFRSFGTKQNDIATQLSEFITADTKWKVDLINTVYREDWQPYNKQRYKNSTHINKFSQEMSLAATEERTNYLRRRFLSRLQFPAIRDRENRIPEAHAATFGWVFAEQKRETLAVATREPPLSARTQTSKINTDTNASTSCPDGYHGCVGLDDVWMKSSFGHIHSAWINQKFSLELFSLEQLHDSTWEKQGLDSIRAVRPSDVPTNEVVNGHLVHWLECQDGIFWITGKPASGKSTLMKYLRKHSTTEFLLRKWAGSGVRLITCTYFFWKAGHEMQKTCAGLLQTLLYDALVRLPELVPKVFPERWNHYELFGDDLDPWSWPELVIAFNKLKDAMADYGNAKIFMMVDGLDECDGSYADLIDLLQAAASRSRNIKVLLGSRPEQSFQDAFGRLPNLRMQDHTLPDITAYVDAELSTQPQFQLFRMDQPTEATALVDGVATKASGVFLWVTLVVRSLIEGLQNGDNVRELQQRLAQIPPELDDLYSSMLQSLDPFYLKDASHLFRIMRAAPGQLNLIDFSVAEELDIGLLSANRLVSLEPEEVSRRNDVMARRLNSRCKGLLEVSRVVEHDESSHEFSDEEGIPTTINPLANSTSEGVHQGTPPSGYSRFIVPSSCNTSDPPHPSNEMFADRESGRIDSHLYRQARTISMALSDHDAPSDPSSRLSNPNSNDISAQGLQSLRSTIGQARSSRTVSNKPPTKVIGKRRTEHAHNITDKEVIGAPGTPVGKVSISQERMFGRRLGRENVRMRRCRVLTT